MKKFLALILALCMVFALCACGGGGAAKTSGGPFAPDGPVTLIVAYKAGSGRSRPHPRSVCRKVYRPDGRR